MNNSIEKGLENTSLLQDYSGRHQNGIEQRLSKLYGFSTVKLFNSGTSSFFVLMQGYLAEGVKKVLVSDKGYYLLADIINDLPIQIELFSVDWFSSITDKEKFIKQLNAADLVIYCPLWGSEADAVFICECCRNANTFSILDLSHTQLFDGIHDRLGSIADSAFLSVGAYKYISCGNGGIALTNNSKIKYLIDSAHGFPGDIASKNHLGGHNLRFSVHCIAILEFEIVCLDKKRKEKEKLIHMLLKAYNNSLSVNTNVTFYSLPLFVLDKEKISKSFNFVKPTIVNFVLCEDKVVYQPASFSCLHPLEYRV